MWEDRGDDEDEGEEEGDGRVSGNGSHDGWMVECLSLLGNMPVFCFIFSSSGLVCRVICIAVSSLSLFFLSFS